MRRSFLALFSKDAERLSERVRTLRRRQGLSQAALAERAGVPRSTIARIELGGGNPNLETMSKIAGAFGVDTVELLDRG